MVALHINISKSDDEQCSEGKIDREDPNATRERMSKEQTTDLLSFLKPFSDDIIDLVMWLRDFAWDQCPQANELIYDNYNAVAFGLSPTEKVGHTACSIAVGRSSKNIHFGFYWGSELSDPDKVLLGAG